MPNYQRPFPIFQSKLQQPQYIFPITPHFLFLIVILYPPTNPPLMLSLSSPYQNMHLIHHTPKGTQLWLGDLGAATNPTMLASKNIKFVYTAAALDVSYSKQHNITHKKIQAYDVPNYDLSQHFQSAYAFLSDSLQKGNVLVHCAAGVSRSATIVIMFLMRHNAWELEKTFTLVKSKRPWICPNPGFCNQLVRFEKNIRPQIELKKEESVVRKFIEEDQKSVKTNRSGVTSVFGRSSMKVADKGAMMTASRAFSTQKTDMRQSKANQMRMSGMKEPVRDQPLVRNLMQSTGFKEPKIVSHKY